MSSLSITPSRVVLATTYGSAQRASIGVYPLALPEPRDSNMPDELSPEHLAAPLLPATARMQVHFQMPEGDTVRPRETRPLYHANHLKLTLDQLFTSSANSYKSPANSASASFAVGSNARTRIFNNAPASFDCSWSVANSADVLACDWQDANVLATGKFLAFCLVPKVVYS